jgi:hypothetical protein
MMIASFPIPWSAYSKYAMLFEQDLTWSIGGSVEKFCEADELHSLCDDNAANARSVLA